MTDDEVVEGIRSVLFHKGDDVVFERGSLTPRERWVVELMAQGATAQELATSRAVGKWRIYAIRKRAKGKIVNNIVRRLVEREEVRR